MMTPFKKADFISEDIARITWAFPLVGAGIFRGLSKKLGDNRGRLCRSGTEESQTPLSYLRGSGCVRKTTPGRSKLEGREEGCSGEPDIETSKNGGYW